MFIAPSYQEIVFLRGWAVSVYFFTQNTLEVLANLSL